MNEPDYIYTTAEQVLVPYGKGTLLHQPGRLAGRVIERGGR